MDVYLDGALNAFLNLDVSYHRTTMLDRESESIGIDCTKLYKNQCQVYFICLVEAGSSVHQNLAKQENIIELLSS